MKLSLREHEILTLAAGGKSSKAIAATLGIAKITVDIHVGATLSKMGALNRNQAIVNAITNKLIEAVHEAIIALFFEASQTMMRLPVSPE
jgi:DNA-binding NarL/FixJ family response regulator